MSAIVTVASPLLRILIIILLTLLGLRLLATLQRRLETRLQQRAPNTEWMGQVKTTIQVTRSVLTVVILFVAILMVLMVLEINISPLLAGAGIAGLAVSLGAQTLIKDFIGGILILFENQFHVGDTVKVAGVSGEVERITLRAVHLRDLDGQVHIVPCGDIRVVTNQSEGWSRALVELAVPYDGDFGVAMTALQNAARAVKDNASLSGVLLSDPEVQAWIGLVGDAVQVRLTAKTRAGSQFPVSLALREQAVKALDAAGIEGTFAGWYFLDHNHQFRYNRVLCVM